MATDTHINLYELLDLDTDTPVTVAEVRDKAKTLLNKWNTASSMGVGARREQASLKRQQLKSARLDTLDDQKLEDRLRADRNVLLQQREVARKAAPGDVQRRLDREMTFAELKGYVLQREIDAWIQAFPEARLEIEQRAKPLLRADEPQDQLSDDHLTRVDGQLAQLGLDSLFDLLDVRQEAISAITDDAMFQKADALYKQAVQHTTEAEWSIKKDLSGEARAIFKNAAQAQQYRDHARMRVFERAYITPVLITCRTTGRLTLEQINDVLDRAVTDGWKRDEAVNRLFELAHARNWRLLPPAATGTATDPAVVKERDEFKRQLDQRNQQLAEAREETIRAREQTRLRDQQRKDAEERARMAQEERDRLARSERDLTAQLTAAQASANQAAARTEQERQAARRRAEALKQQLDDVQRQLQEAQQGAEENKRQRIAEEGPRFADHMARNQLIAAERIVKSFAETPPSWQADAERIQRDIARARQLLDEAKREAQAGRSARVESLLAQSLSLCADLEEGIAFRATLPPAPPTQLRATAEGDCVALSWEPSSSRDVRYIVVRKDGAAPRSTHDGQAMPPTTATAWRDLDPPPARPLWYAVFAERGGVMAQRGAATSGAVTVMPEVSDLRAEAGSGQVILSWRPPNYAHAVVVTRNQSHAPATDTDGERRILPPSSRYADTNLVDGQLYYYRVFCEYDGPDGLPALSTGASVSATSEAPVSEPPELSLEGADGFISHTVLLDASRPARGELVIYRTSTEPVVAYGERLSVERLEQRLGAGRLRITGDKDTLSHAGCYVYTPVIISQGSALVGAPQTYLWGPAPRLVTAVDDPAHGLIIRWQWPQGCESAAVTCQALTPRGGPARSATVSRQAGQARGECVVSGLASGEHRIEVVGRYQINGQLVYSSKVTVESRHDTPT